MSAKPASNPTSIELKQNSFYLTPHLGWMWGWAGGFTVGFEMGWQFPLSPQSELNISISDPTLNSLLAQLKQTSQYQSLESDTVKVANRLGKTSIPFITFLRMGWTF